MTEHNGMAFSTDDRDQDNSSENCARKHKGGWWYNDCYRVNLNGLYNPGHTDVLTAMAWAYWPTKNVFSTGLKASKMAIRPL